jgi:DNA-binding XRE family transcriptional regulator
MKNDLILMEPPVVTGPDLKSFRQKNMRMNQNQFAACAGISRQELAGLERLTRPLTKQESMSAMPRVVRLSVYKPH